MYTGAYPAHEQTINFLIPFVSTAKIMIESRSQYLTKFDLFPVRAFNVKALYTL